jgi:kanamycin kinase/aminoglycoside 3'-phosphotransferase-3
MERFKLPQAIQKYTKDMICEKNEVGRSNAHLYHYTNSDKDYYLKIEKTNSVFEHEQKILQWLQKRLSVPKIVVQCREHGKDFLLMTKVVGEMALSDKYLKNPLKLVSLLAEGIKKLHAVDISDCPFDCTLNNTLKYVWKRVENNEVNMNNWKESTQFNTPKDLYDYLLVNQPEEELVFSHGDYCLPNVFFDNEKVTGFIDLGNAGISDKWEDIASCIRSLEINLKSKEYTNVFLECLNIKPDYEKINYYSLLNELYK